MRRIVLSHTLNTRDLGDYPAGGGAVTVCGRFLRSDVPLGATEADIRLLLEMGITTVVDLRNNTEVAQKPCALSRYSAFTYWHCKMAGDGRVPGSADEVPASYMEMVDDPQAMEAVMRAVAAAPGSVLFHCTAGKDRTGVVSALLLSLAGVSQADVMADYQVSESYLLPVIRQLCLIRPELSLDILTPKAAYMETFLELFYRKYHTAREYLTAIGLEPAAVEALRKKLIGG